MKKIIKKILPDVFLKIIKKIINKKYEYNQIKFFNNIKFNIKNICYYNEPNILSELCEKYGSDKGFVNLEINKKPYNWYPHTYSSYYHSIFNLSRENIKYVFECGLGTNNPNIKRI